MTRPAIFCVLVLLASIVDVRVAPQGAPVRPGLAITGNVQALPGALHGRSTSLAAGASASVESVAAIERGWISWAEPEHGGDYLAARLPRGTLVQLCARTCIVRRTTDFGPHAGIRPNRIADLAVLDWEVLCGLPRERGVCPGTIEVLASITLPATDTDEGGRP